VFDVLGYVICLSNSGYPVSLEPRKVYECLAPAPRDPKERIRVVDESGEDYLYPREFFVPVTLPKPVLRAFATRTV
jgi:hypothetical protein